MFLRMPFQCGFLHPCPILSVGSSNLPRYVVFQNLVAKLHWLCADRVDLKNLGLLGVEMEAKLGSEGT